MTRSHSIFYYFALAVAHVATAFALTCDAAPATQPATQPVPNRLAHAQDLPLDLHGVTGPMLERLKLFDVPPNQFDYRLDLISDEEFLRVYRLTFPSAVHSGFDVNDSVPAEYFVPRNPPPRMPAAIVLDILDGRGVVARGLARGLAEHNVAALYVPMAYYGPRRPPGNVHVRLFMADPSQSVAAIRQTVLDVRRAKAILDSITQIDSRHIGITGVSLGGIMTALSAGVDGHFDRVAPILAGADIAALIFHTRETRMVRARLQEMGVTQTQLEKLLDPVEPLHFVSRIDPRRCLMINGLSDEVIPRWTTDDLIDAIGSPRVIWLPSGHYSSVLYLPTIRQTVARFMAGD